MEKEMMNSAITINKENRLLLICERNKSLNCVIKQAELRLLLRGEKMYE